MGMHMWRVGVLCASVILTNHAKDIDRIGSNPPEVLTYVKQFLPDNPVILEAGACSGEDSVRMKQMWSGATVHAFEPDPTIFGALTKTVQGIEGIHIYHYALGKEMGTVLFNSCICTKPGVSSGCGSLYTPTDEFKAQISIDNYFTKVVEVPLITIDEWAKRNGVTAIDFMWLDMQGGELAALKEGKTILPTVKVIYTEVMFKEAYEKQPLYANMVKFLKEQGFRIAARDFVEKDTEVGREGNVVFVKDINV